MNLILDKSLADGYRSNSQIARILTENWVAQNSYCPCCGCVSLMEFENNRPVADFYCKECNEEYELKSKNGKLVNTIMDGAYSSMIERINSENNPNLFFLTYTNQLNISDFLIIPKQFFTTDIIIERPPLANTARRAGWIGCNIDISKVSDSGKVFLVKNGKIINKQIVQDSFKKTLFLREKSKNAKGWILDILNCIDLINKETFMLEEVYAFEEKLKLKYPQNNFVKDKIRQQLQILRDKGIIEFNGRGRYRKI